jgi:GT2 family glycosyltransferase
VQGRGGEGGVVTVRAVEFIADQRDAAIVGLGPSSVTEKQALAIGSAIASSVRKSRMPATALLSVVIPTRDRPELLQACLTSIDRHPAGCDLEIVVADNGSVEPNTLALLERFSLEDRGGQPQIVVSVPGSFNYSRINNVAVEHSKGLVVLLLNNDVEFLHAGWGLELASHALRPGIGCVGAQLLYPDHTVQHGGVILGVGGLAGHAHQDFPGDVQGYQGRLQLAQELSAVTGACLAISRNHWQALEGLDATHLAVNYNDVDLGLRARQLGLRNL